MFRLEDRQLHILIGLLFGASVLLFCIFGLGNIPKIKTNGTINGLKDFSEAWVCTYEPQNADVLNDEGETKVMEVINAPTLIPVKSGEKVTLTHKTPEMGADTTYLVLEAKKQNVKVYVNQELLYKSSKSDEKVSSLHIIPVPPQYRDMMLTIELTGTSERGLEVGAIQTGSYTEVIVQAFLNNGVNFITGLILFAISICAFVVWSLVNNKWRQKKILLYGCLEGTVFGVLFLLESDPVRVILNWDYGLFFLKACLIVIVAVLHLVLMRCFLYKKRMLFLVDLGVLFYGIFYISMMVLQAFSLLEIDTVYLIGRIMFAVSVFLYTIVLFVARFGYGQKETTPNLVANGLLISSFGIWLLFPLLRSWTEWKIYILPGGVLLYMLLSWLYGLKRLLHFRPEKEMVRYDEEAVRKQVVEGLNPNLLFASFQTLQNLIKNGSANSVKMIYYISVYIRSNLKALEKRGEVIPFEEELEHIIAYLQLQKTRNENLNFTIECKVKEFKLPRHSIEPLVENAVKHGIAGNGNKGNIAFRTYMREEGYAIQIIDDGVGFDKSVLRRKSPTAILNLFSLLEQSCQAKTEVITKEERGTVITIILPELENDLMENPAIQE